MKNNFSISILLGLLMLLAGVLSKVMTPSIQAVTHHDRVNLEVMIPREFGKWMIDPKALAILVSPDTQGLLNKIYSQTLSRTYINNEGDRVMLSIAYGRDQSTDLHVHRPEVCYAAGGFDIDRMNKAYVDTTIGRIPVMHLVAKQGARIEPITYWIRVGDSLTRGWIEQKLTTIAFGLTGKVPDGLLFRVSTISNDELASYRIQQSFLSAILQAVRSEDRYWLVGQLSP